MRLEPMNLLQKKWWVEQDSNLRLFGVRTRCNPVLLPTHGLSCRIELPPECTFGGPPTQILRSRGRSRTAGVRIMSPNGIPFSLLYTGLLLISGASSSPSAKIVESLFDRSRSPITPVQVKGIEPSSHRPKRRARPVSATPGYRSHDMNSITLISTSL